MADLRAALVIDYQNVHLTGHGRFDSTRFGPKHEALVERDQRVHVTLRPLKYRYQRDANGHPVRDPSTGLKIPSGPPQEKGVDVLCALALVRRALSKDVDLVILASHDSDLVPAIDEVLELGTAKVETFSWYAPGEPSYELCPTDRSKRIWNTRPNEHNFLNCLDRTQYE